MSNENKAAANILLKLKSSENYSNHSNYHRSSTPPSSNASFSPKSTALSTTTLPESVAIKETKRSKKTKDNQ